MNLRRDIRRWVRLKLVSFTHGFSRVIREPHKCCQPFQRFSLLRNCSRAKPLKRFMEHARVVHPVKTG